MTKINKFIFILAAITFNSGFCHALTLSDLRTEIRRACNDNPSDTSFRRYSDAFLLDFINQAQREIVSATWLNQHTTSYVLSPNTTFYNLPTDLLAVEQVYFTNSQGQTIELSELSQKSLYDQNPMWQRQTGTPNSYWVSMATFGTLSPIGSNRISYIPIPTRTSTGTVFIWYDASVLDLSSDSDIPFEAAGNLYAYHILLAYNAIFRIKLIEGRSDQAGIYQQMYSSGINQMMGKLGEAPNYSPRINIPGVGK